ncbi:MAG: hypothetical protein ACRDYA_16910 [Egibacteraceae bacterium]
MTQVRDLTALLGDDGPGPLFRSDRVFSTEPDPAPPGTVGQPRRHSERFSCADPSTWSPPGAELTTAAALRHRPRASLRWPAPQTRPPWPLG